jgi:magnesium transporter
MKEIFAEKGTHSKVIWIDLCEPTAEELDAVALEYGLHAYTVRDCLEAGHLPKFEEVEGYKFMIVRSYAPKTEHNPHTIQDMTTKVAVFFSDTVVITIHRKHQPFLKTIKEKYCTTTHKWKTEELVVKVLWYALHSFELAGLTLSQETDHYEERIFLNKNIPDLQQKLYYIKHKASVSKKVLLLTTEVINQVHHAHGNNPYIQDVRDLHLKLVTIYDQTQDDINNLLNIYISLATQKTNEVMKVLTLLSAFFMPLTFIVGVYGMNFKYMPELEDRLGYPMIMAFMALLSISIFIWFKHKKWM